MGRIIIDLWGDTRDDAALTTFVGAVEEAGVNVAFAPPGERDRPGEVVWQTQDDPFARSRAFMDGAEEVIGPWMAPCEALARVVRHTRRPASRHAARIDLGELAIDLLHREAVRAGRKLPLLKREMDLLTIFARQPGAILSRKHLLRDVWSLSFDPGTNIVQVHMSRLRTKLDHGFAWPMLRTVRGAGYMLQTQPCC